MAAWTALESAAADALKGRGAARACRVDVAAWSNGVGDVRGAGGMMLLLARRWWRPSRRRRNVHWA